MVARISNTEYLTVVEPAPLEGVGWTVRVLSERDYRTPIAFVERFVELGFTVEANEEGGGTVTLDPDDEVLTAPLPVGEHGRLPDQEALWQILEDGQVRAEFLAEDVDEDVIAPGSGLRSTVVAGRGTGCVLEWAPALPENMPNPTTTTTRYNRHPLAAWVHLFRKAQAAGFLPFVSLLFDANEDSAGEPWGAPQELEVTAGTNLLELLKRWCEANELVWRMLPGFRLQVLKSAGHRREGEVVFTQYRSQGEHRRKLSRRELANVVYVDSGDGIAVAADESSASRWRRRAAWVSAGDAADASARSMIANTTLGLSKDQKLSRSVKLEPDVDGRRPFVDFDVHDWVGVEVPDDDTESGVSKVVGLAVAVDTDGVVEVEATLQSRFELRAVRTQRELSRINNGARSGGGSGTSSPIPASKVLAATKLGDLSDVDLVGAQEGSLLRLVGSRWVDVTANLDLLADVDTGQIPATGDVALVYDRTEGLWRPGKVSAGGGGGGGGVSVSWSFADPWAAGTRYASTRRLGTSFLATAAGTIRAVRCKIDTVAGVTYRATLLRVAQATRTVLEVVGSVEHLTPAAQTGVIVALGDVEWTVEAGQVYALLVERADGASPALYYVSGSATGSATVLGARIEGVMSSTATLTVGSNVPGFSYPFLVQIDATLA